MEGKQDKTGTLYRRNRSYDPLAGRFTQEDPIGLAGGVNLYGFAAGDPVNFADPFGLMACDIANDPECMARFSLSFGLLPQGAGRFALGPEASLSVQLSFFSDLTMDLDLELRGGGKVSLGGLGAAAGCSGSAATGSFTCGTSASVSTQGASVNSSGNVGIGGNLGPVGVKGSINIVQLIGRGVRRIVGDVEVAISEFRETLRFLNGVTRQP